MFNLFSCHYSMKVVLVCIAKLEHLYIEEFCKHHLSIGFDAIYIYDNEDVPTYHRIGLPKVHVIHFPGKVMQHKALEHFQTIPSNYTHMIHMDCDEFIVLKKHATIQDFIQEYIQGDCVGIGINWRFFGDSHKKYTNEPLRKRFTWCQRNGDPHIKTLFKKDSFVKYNTVHDVAVKQGHIKSTNGTIIKGPWNHAIDLSVIQLNHYKTKTLEEFIYIRQRGRADVAGEETMDKILESFHAHNFNEVQDLTLFNKMI